MKTKKLDYVYNCSPHTYPDGLDVEVFTFKAIKKAHLNAKNQYQKEHVTTYFRDNIKKYKTRHIKCPIKNISNLRITLDNSLDLKLIRSIYKSFYPNIYFSWKELVDLYNKNKKIFKLSKNPKTKKRK